MTKPTETATQNPFAPGVVDGPYSAPRTRLERYARRLLVAVYVATVAAVLAQLAGWL